MGHEDRLCNRDGHGPGWPRTGWVDRLRRCGRPRYRMLTIRDAVFLPLTHGEDRYELSC